MDDLGELLDRCRAGDALAWETLVRRFQGRVFGVALHYMKDPEEARDVAQDAFVKVYRGLGSFEGHLTFPAWLLLVTRNLCIDQLRRRKARPPARDVAVDDGPEIASPAPGPDEEHDARDRRSLVYRALGRLTPINREIVLLKEIQGLSLDEVASILAVPVGTVKSRSSRARIELARHVLALDPDYGRAAS